MAKETRRVTVKGLLDVDEGTITEFLKDEGEITHKLHDLFLPFNGCENVNINISFDTDILPKE